MAISRVRETQAQPGLHGLWKPTVWFFVATNPAVSVSPPKLGGVAATKENIAIASLLERTGAKREPDRAKLQENGSKTEMFRNASLEVSAWEPPRLRERNLKFFIRAATPPDSGGETRPKTLRYF